MVATGSIAHAMAGRPISDGQPRGLSDRATTSSRLRLTDAVATGTGMWQPKTGATIMQHEDDVTTPDTDFRRRLFQLRFRRLRLSQKAFAAHYGVSFGMVRDVEQGRSPPSRAFRSLVAVIDRDPALVAEAVGECTWHSGAMQVARH
jgi:DNA-binding transcriptional regulator YiaG